MATPKQLVWRFNGQDSFERQGITVHNAGDVDADGVPDIITGLYTVASAATGNHVSARVYSGRSGALLLGINAPFQSHGSHNTVASLVDPSGNHPSLIVIGTPGAKVGVNEGAGVVRIFDSAGVLLETKYGPSPAALFGASVASAGDVDGDHRPDLIVGAPGVDQAYVYSGDPATGFALLATLGGPERSRFGASVGTAGDIDGDGRSEVVVGAPYFMAAGGHAGRIYVFRVANPATPLHTVTGSGPTDLLGTAVDGGRDLNGDGVPDFIGAAMGTDISGPKGVGYVRTYSGANAAVLRTFTTGQAGDLFGFSAALSDPCLGSQPTLVVGAPQALNPFNGLRAGRVLVFDVVTGAQITQIFGEHLMDGMGISVAAFVDLTGEGRAEFLAGAHGMSQAPTLWTNGSAFVYSCTNIPGPDLVAVPNPVDFGNVAVGTTQTLTVQIQNQGDADLVVTNLTLGPGSNAAFTFSAPLTPFTIPPSGSHSVTVSFSPATKGVHGGGLQVHSNDPDGPTYDLPLVGNGLQREIQVTPASSHFGPVDQGDVSWDSITVKNVGNEALIVNGLTLAPGSHSDFTLGGLPTLPKPLGPGQDVTLQAIFQPTGQGLSSGTIEVGSNDPANPTVQVPLSGTGVLPNQRPTAVIGMDVPYNGNTVQFRGDQSFDPDGTIVSYQWDFGHDGQVSTAPNPVHTFPCTDPDPCLMVVRLVVTDDGGKSDPTSVTAIAWDRQLRSRFYGTIKQGGFDVPDGTVVEAWINNKKVAEGLSQTHLGQPVFAIEIPPDIHDTGDGGKDGNVVVFKYKLATANETGTWYRATDQELNLTAPFYVPPFLEWCILAQALGLEVCGPSVLIPEGGIIVDLQEWPVPPIPDPGPLRRVGTAFELTLLDARTGQPIHELQSSYEIRISYIDRQLAAAGIADERSLELYHAKDGRWIPAGRGVLDMEGNQMVTRVGHGGVFALFGPRASATTRELRRR
jgi:hypothetical protein